MSFVGIGMGAIQAGLFLPRAQEAGLKTTVLVRRPEQARAIAKSRRVEVNVAGDLGLEHLTLRGVTAEELYGPKAVGILTEARQIAVAVSSVADYASLAPILAQASRAKAEGQGPPAVIYASENALDAAEQLTQAILHEGGDPSTFQALDTVIGKMSRTVRDAQEQARLGLIPGAPGLPEAWFVESFDDIYVSELGPSPKGLRLLPRLTPVPDLEPFERAKLNGHNAAHATLAYAGQVLGLRTVADVMAVKEVRDFVKRAFIQETGQVLIERYGDTAPLFTARHWRAHGDALFARMANPLLQDDCARVGRDAMRKLGWNDRLVGTVRLVQSQDLMAPRWSMAIYLALDAAGLTLDEVARSWRASGAPLSEVACFVGHLTQHHLSYLNWRQEIDPQKHIQNLKDVP